MKRLKKLVILALCLVMAFSFTACEQSDVTDVASPIGKWFGNTYDNYRFLLQVDVPEDWTIYDEEARLALIGVTQDTVGANDLETLLDRAGTFIDLYIADPEDTQHMTITVEKAAVLNRMVYTADGLLEDSKDLYVQNLESAGATDVQAEIVSKDLAGSSRDCLVVSANNGGTMIYMEMFYIKSAKYYCCVNIASNGSDMLSNMEAMIGAATLPTGGVTE